VARSLTRRAGGALVLAALLGTWVVSGQVVATPPIIAAAAILPPLGWAGLVLLLDRRTREHWMPLCAAFLWGAAAAALISSEVNDALLATPGIEHLVPTLLGPTVEEVAKASALLVVLAVWRGEIHDALDGIVYGALAGLGFAATENLGYYTLAAIQGGTPGLGRALWLRGFLQGMNHAAFTATAGAAIGWAYGRAIERPARVGIVLVGLALAILVHAVWNTVASETITQLLCGAPTPGAACTPAPAPLDILVTVPIVVATFVGPVALCLLAIASRIGRSR
jgi:RsiW-degrading membrane proteinase PrsW (M82 family)